MRLKLVRPLVFFDVETTGLKAKRDKILTLSITRIEPAGGPIPEQIKGKMITLKFDPGFPVPPEITKLTGITPLDVFGCPRFEQKRPQIEAIFAGADLVAYNGQFDVDFMAAEFERFGGDFEALLAPDYVLLDPRAAFVLHFGGKHTLEDAVGYYLHKTLEGAHTSAADVAGMIEVFFAQLQKHDLKGTPQDIWEATSGRFEDKRYRFAKDAHGKVTIMFGKHRGTWLWTLITAPSKKQQGYIDWCKKNLDPGTVKYIEEFEERCRRYIAAQKR
jgi:DNA polymerase-3 subunit epsilon